MHSNRCLLVNDDVYSVICIVFLEQVIAYWIFFSFDAHCFLCPVARIHTLCSLRNDALRGINFFCEVQSALLIMTESSELIEISYTGLNGDLKNPTLQNELSHPIKTNYGSSTSTSTILTVLGVQKYIKRGTILSSSINLSNSNIGIGYILYSIYIVCIRTY